MNGNEFCQVVVGFFLLFLLLLLILLSIAIVKLYGKSFSVHREMLQIVQRVYHSSVIARSANKMKKKRCCFKVLSTENGREDGAKERNEIGNFSFCYEKLRCKTKIDKSRSIREMSLFNIHNPFILSSL